jgi:hypothetical protein
MIGQNVSIENFLENVFAWSCVFSGLAIIALLARHRLMLHKQSLIYEKAETVESVANSTSVNILPLVHPLQLMNTTRRSSSPKEDSPV